MTKEEEIINRFQSVNMDPEERAARRVYQKVFAAQSAQPSRLKWMLAGALPMLLVAVWAFWQRPADTSTLVCSAIRPQAAEPAPAPRQEGLSEEDCADLNTKYLLEQNRRAHDVFVMHDKECSGLGKPVSAYDSKLISSFEKELHRAEPAPFTPDELGKLKACTEKFKPKVHPVVLYRMDC